MALLALALSTLPGPLLSASLVAPAGRGGARPPEPVSATQTTLVPARLQQTAQRASPGPVPGGGVLSGIIVDEANAPLAGATVTALRARHVLGEEQVIRVTATSTDADGAFRLVDLPGGRYYVAVSPPGSAPVTAANAVARVQIFGAASLPPTYYPGTSDPDRAEAVRVLFGQHTGGLYVRVAPIPLRQVSGMVVDSQGRPASDAVALLNTVSRRAAPLGVSAMLATRTAETNPKGRFSFPAVPPGEYRIDVRGTAYFEALARRGGGGIGQSQREDAPEFASVPVRVAEDDVEELIVRTGHGFRLTGRVRVEGATVNEHASLLRVMRVIAHELSGGPASRAMATAATDVRPDGTFELRYLAGKRLIRVDGGLRGMPGWMLESVRGLTSDVVDTGLDMQSDVYDIEIVVTRATTVIGRITDRRGDAVPNASVIVFPVDRDRWSMPRNRYVRAVRARDDGSFDVAGLPASDYYAAALAGAESDDYDFDDLVGQAVRFSLNEGEQRALQLRLR